MMSTPETKADSTVTAGTIEEDARSFQAASGWTMFVLVILVKTGWWLMLIGALLVVAYAAMTVSDHPSYGQTRKRTLDVRALRLLRHLPLERA